MNLNVKVVKLFQLNLHFANNVDSFIVNHALKESNNYKILSDKTIIELEYIAAIHLGIMIRNLFQT